MLLTTTVHARAFECTAYIDGKATGEIMKVNAAKAIVAETKAFSRLKKEKITVDYIKCK